MQFSSSEIVEYVSCLWDDKTLSTTGTFHPRFPESTTKGWYRNLLGMINDTCLLKILCVTDWFVLKILLKRLCLHSLSCYHYPITFSEFVFSHSLHLSWVLYFTTNNICNSWHKYSNKSAPNRFAAGTIYLRKNRIEVLPKTWTSAPKSRPRCRPVPLKNEICTCLEATNF